VSVPGRNVRVGTQTIGPNYHFTEESALVESARGILAMGSDILKINLRPASYGLDAPAGLSLVEVASQVEDFRTVFDLPFSTYFLWAQPVTPKGSGPMELLPSAGREAIIYRQVYDLTVWLLTTYTGSGKTFHIGNWEGDWILLQGYDFTKNPDPAKVEGLHRNFEIRQKAVSDAREATPHANVWAGHYIEVNRPLDALDKGMRRVTNAILPELEVDLISYSAYDALRPNRIQEALSYIESQARFTPYFDHHYEKKVFIGEYDAYEDYHVNGYSDPHKQCEHTLQVIREALSWGCPFVLFWEYYNNEDVRLIHGGGFWLIDSDNEKQPVWYLHHQLLHDIREWLDTTTPDHSLIPSNAEWQSFIAQWTFSSNPYQPPKRHTV
jgi:hypothetical protein